MVESYVKVGWDIEDRNSVCRTRVSFRFFYTVADFHLDETIHEDFIANSL